MTSKSAMESFYSETSSYSLKAMESSNKEFNEIHWILAMKDAKDLIFPNRAYHFIISLEERNE